MLRADFLANEAATHSLSPEQTAAFVERLKTENSGKSELNLAIELGIEEDTFTKRMTAVYKKFAQSYPELATSLNNLGELYSSTERYSEAEPLYQQALELKKRLLGDNHPDVAIILNNLAALYGSTRRYSEAEPLYQQALAIREQILGVDHPDTMTVRENYAIFLREAYR